MLRERARTAMVGGVQAVTDPFAPFFSSSSSAAILCCSQLLLPAFRFALHSRDSLPLAMHVFLHWHHRLGKPAASKFLLKRVRLGVCGQRAVRAKTASRSGSPLTNTLRDNQHSRSLLSLATPLDIEAMSPYSPND